jgi:very-short-patch-repair endonuclease
LARKRLTPIARKLRKEPTEAEIRLWHYLRAKQIDGAKFTRQFPIGNYVADFAEWTLRIAIKLDGGQHATSKTDAERTEIIELYGYRVIRFWNNDVLGNTEGVIEEIRRMIAIARNGDRP